jgi:hypothetical protein
MFMKLRLVSVSGILPVNDDFSKQQRLISTGHINSDFAVTGTNASKIE